MQQKKHSKEIKKFYNVYPFPNLDIKNQKDCRRKGLHKLIYPLTKPYLKDKNLKILDAGCGTGELAFGLEREGLEIEAVDLSQSSIAIAKRRAKMFGSKVKFKVFDFVKNSLPEKKYDLVYSIGVLHHTDDPPYSFKKLLRSTKIGGYIIIGIYNPFGEFRFRVKRAVVKLLAGSSIEKRVEIGQKLFGKKSHDISISAWTAIADAYANPYRKYYTFNQLLHWFKVNNVEFMRSLPPIGIINNLYYIYEIIKNLFRNRNLNLITSYRRILEKDIKTRHWELNPIITFLVQVPWLIIGRGTLINIVGKRMK